jgi:hypothetical protein
LIAPWTTAGVLVVNTEAAMLLERSTMSGLAKPARTQITASRAKMVLLGRGPMGNVSGFHRVSQ